jgi:dUTP pyrophosphatase
LRQPTVKIFALPGGQLPARQTKGAIGYDVHLRAVVCAHEMDLVNPRLRRLLFDFEKPPKERRLISHVLRLSPSGKKLPLASKTGELVYRLLPGERVLVGIGFVTEMEFPMFYWVVPRSGLASKYGITVENTPGTVDPDYRGEAGVIVCNRSKKPFDLKRGMRIGQVLFQKALIPKFVVVSGFDDLSTTERGAGGFGSTGLEAKKK